jgi:peptide/nickel transport system permease protein
LAEQRWEGRERQLRRYQRASMRSVWRRPLTTIGLVIVVIWAVVAIFAPLIAPHDPIASGTVPYLSPSWSHLFGTDELGRDEFSRVIYGARVTLPLALLLVALSAGVGGILGGIAGYYGRWLDELIMRIADIFFSFPTIILAMAVAAALGPSLENAVLAIVVVSWPMYARVVRSLVLGARDADYVAASRLLGASTRRSLGVDILPNIIGPVAVLAVLELGNAVLWLCGLSFLGLGAQPPTAEWGAMISDGAQEFNRWWLGVFPGVAILTVVLAFNFIGDSLRDALDSETNRALARRTRV